jgi:hypothetical protein
MVLEYSVIDSSDEDEEEPKDEKNDQDINITFFEYTCKR